MARSAIDLFCGCGGLSRGLSDAGINVVLGIDVWDRAIETYQHNFPDHTAICGDMKSLDPADIAERIGMHHVDIIAGGPPCQAYSIAGRRDSKDPRASLFKEYLRFVEYFRPKIVLMENVQGLLSSKNEHGEKVIEIIEKEFQNIGYRVSYKTLLASDFEVPQNRKRVIFLGRPIDDLSEITHPAPILHEADHIPVSSILLNEQDVPRSYFLSEKAIEGIRKKKETMKEKGFGFGAQFLKMDKPSYTIPSRYYKDGYDALVKYSDSNIRRLTEREAARVQSFPDTFEIKGSKKEVYMQIGNAVPVKLAYHIGLHIINELL